MLHLTYYRGFLEKFANFVALACVAHFLWSYYRNCYRKGYSLDVWHFFLATNLFTIHIMLPFDRGDLNIFALGPILLRRSQDYMTEAYLISAFGYICMILGGSLWRVHLGLGMRDLFSRLIELPTRASLLLLRSKRLLITHGIIAISMMIGVLLYYFKVNGFGFNLRELLITMPKFRSIAQFTAFYAVLIASYCLARFYQYKESSMKLIVFLIIVGLLFFGERSNLVGVALMTIMVMFIQKGRKLKLIWLVTGIFSAFFLAFSLDALRQPHFSLRSMMANSIIATFYGNSFSDTRDFAIVLSFWDGHYFLGKTYLAGLFAFVPRFLSDFRNTWAIGVVTATMAGFNPAEHPGLRVGNVGEAYLNFGLIGVFLLSFFIGACVRLIDLRMKQSAATLLRPNMRIYSYYVITFFVSACINSSNASTFYVILFVLLASWAILNFSSYRPSIR